MIRTIRENKKQYLDLLLLADEQEDMIDRYLARGTLFVMEEAGLMFTKKERLRKNLSLLI